ncbi:transglycosylase domain-containing protein [Natronospora cellulosivora (SeqCode)]
MAKKKHVIISGIILFIAIFFGLTIGAITFIIQNTPDISNYRGASQATLLYSADGELLTRLYSQNRISVPRNRIPSDLQNAFIAIEDTNFFVHHGIDFWGIGRAVVTNFIQRRARPHGASTITQQLAGNTLLDRQDVSYYRKLQEAYLALQFERLYTKPEILEMYLNEIFLGHSAWGVQAAAQQYFAKDVWELTLSESALIAGITRGPNYYSPFNNYDRAIGRRNVVLNRMEELGYITPEEAEEAKNEELNLKRTSPINNDFAPYFVRYVRDELINMFGSQIVYSGGLKVYTTLDPNMQRKAEEEIARNIEERYIPTIERSNTADPQQPQMSLVTLDVKTGEIRAMVGGRGNDQFNRATQAVRQPGSAFKTFVYTAAIQEGYSASSVINDMPMLARKEEDEPLRIWPRNYSNEYRGFVTLREALKRSINVPAVKLLQEVGIDKTVRLVEEMGITTLQDVDRHGQHLALALGGLNKGVTPLEMASAYGIYANQGVYVEPSAITRVLDSQDNVIYRSHTEKRIVLSEDDAYIITSMLQSVVDDAGGTGWRTRLGNQASAGKTGTTNNYTDAWYVGYTPDLVTSVWIGEDNIAPMNYTQRNPQGEFIFPEGHRTRVSSAEAARIWGGYMNNVVADMPVSHFPVPNNIVRDVEIDPLSGLLANEYTERTVREIFRENNVPTETSNITQAIATARIDKESGLLASNNCPEENIVEYQYYLDSRIRIADKRIEFGTEQAIAQAELNDEEFTESDIHGVYIVEGGQPLQQIDLGTGVPLTDDDGNILFETIPEEECDIHGQTENDNLINSIWDFFLRQNN